MVEYCEEGTGTGWFLDLPEIITHVDTNLPTGVTDPDSALDRPLVLANFGGSQNVIGVCGDYGLGFGPIERRFDIVVDSFEAYTAGYTAGCLVTESLRLLDADGPSPLGVAHYFYSDPSDLETGEWVVQASACLLGCPYAIDDLTESSEVILALIDGHWWIVKVVSGALVEIASKRCNCCYTSDHILSITIEGDNIPETTFDLRPDLRNRWDGSSVVECLTSGTSTIAVSLICTAEPTEQEPSVDDWALTICGVSLEIGSVTCEDEMAEDSCGLVLTASGGVETMTCCGSTITARIVDTCRTADDECYEDVLGDLVLAEACGMPDLEQEAYIGLDGRLHGVHVIMAYMSRDDSETGTGTGDVKYFVITACADKNGCPDPCEPPPPDPGPKCCGIDCIDWPDEIAITVEFNGDCGTCSASDVMTKTGCDIGVEYESIGIGCNGTVSPFAISDLTLACGVIENECAGPGDPKPTLFSFADVINGGYTLNEETACCDPLFLEFTFANAQACTPLAMEEPTANVTVTITA